MRLNDAVIGIALILFALAMIAYTRTFPAMPGQDYGPALFPVLDRHQVHRHRRHPGRERPAPARAEPLFGGGEWHAPVRTSSTSGRGRRPPALHRGIGWLGFIVTSLLLLFGWLVLFRGGKPISSFVIALAVTLCVDYAFQPAPPGTAAARRVQPLLY